MKEGDIAGAESLCRAHLDQAPNDVSAIRLLAKIASLRGKPIAAEKLLERCLSLAPRFHLARLDYVAVLNGQQKPQQALEQLKPLEEIDANSPQVLALKAKVLMQAERAQEAIDCYAKLLARGQGSASDYADYGFALKTLGRFEEAVATYLQALALSPGNAEALWGLAELKTYTFSDSQLTVMEEQVQRKPKSGDESRICFALGKAHEDRLDFRKSFKFYARGNEIQRQRVNYSSAINRGDCARAMSLFDRDFFASREGHGCDDCSPIFIVGLPRSGSTLLEQMLASHSQIEGIRELPHIINMARQLGTRGKASSIEAYHNALGELSPQRCAALGEEYLDLVQPSRRGAPYFIDKMPNNFAHIALIQLILPRAAIIDCRREGMATCFSVYKQLFANGQGYSYSLEDTANYYLDYLALMSHWDSVLPGRVIGAQYETLITRTEEGIRSLLDRLQLPFEERCLEFHRTERAVNTPSAMQVRQPVYRDALEQWRNYIPDLQILQQLLQP